MVCSISLLVITVLFPTDKRYESPYWLYTTIQAKIRRLLFVQFHLWTSWDKVVVASNSDEHYKLRVNASIEYAGISVDDFIKAFDNSYMLHCRRYLHSHSCVCSAQEWQKKQQQHNKEHGQIETTMYLIPCNKYKQ